MLSDIGLESKESDKNRLPHVSLSQYHPSNIYPSFSGSVGIEMTSLPIVEIVLTISPSTSKFIENSIFLLHAVIKRSKNDEKK